MISSAGPRAHLLEPSARGIPGALLCGGEPGALFVAQILAGVGLGLERDGAHIGAIVFAYVVRFLPQALAGASSAFARVSPQFEEAARGLGRSREDVCGVRLGRGVGCSDAEPRKGRG